MSMFERITEDIKIAMRSKDIVKRDCLRSVVSEIKNQTVNAGKEITDAVCLKVLQKAAKQHMDSIESFKAGNREDLALKELEELKHIEAYLPKMMSEEETKSVIYLILQNIEATKRNMGLIMKQLPPEADKKVAAKILNKILN